MEGFTAVEDVVNFGTEGELDVVGFGWAEVAEGVSAGCCEGDLCLVEDLGKEWVVGDADGDVWEACGDEVRDDSFFREYEGKGAWPEVVP